MSFGFVELLRISVPEWTETLQSPSLQAMLKQLHPLDLALDDLYACADKKIWPIKRSSAPCLSPLRIVLKDDRAATQLTMSLKSILLVLGIAATAYCQTAQNFDVAEYRRCARASAERICTDSPEYVRGLLRTAENCASAEAAGFASVLCARDEEADLYCAAAEAYPTDLGAAEVACASARQPGGQCSAECRNTLMTIRNNLGCCFNAFFNNSEIYSAIFPLTLSYALWSSCGMEPPNRTCPGELPFTLPSTPLQTCTFDDLEACRESDFDEIRKSIAGEPSCGAVLQYNIDKCSRRDESKEGTACLLELGADTLVTLPSLESDCGVALLPQSTQCFGDCRESLEEFATSRGCCINSLYNSTYSVVTGFNYTISYFQNTRLFNLCGVDRPPLTCDSGSLPLKGFTLMMLLSLVLAALLGNKFWTVNNSNYRDCRSYYRVRDGINWLCCSYYMCTYTYIYVYTTINSTVKCSCIHVYS